MHLTKRINADLTRTSVWYFTLFPEFNFFEVRNFQAGYAQCRYVATAKTKIKMGSKQFNSYLKTNFTSFLSEAGLKKKGNSFISVEQEEILKGFAFSRVDERLYVHWFILPFIPVTEDLSLDVGERLVGNHETIDLFLLEDEKLEKTTSMLKELIKEKINTLKSINSIKDYYNHFYEQNNWNRLNDLWFKSELHNLERIIFAKAYLGIPFEKELKAFRKKWESDDRNHVSWMQDMNRRMDTLVEAEKEGKEAVYSLLKTMKKETIENLNLRKYL